MYRSADQQSVSLSTCAVESFVLSQGMHMVIYLRSMLLEMFLILHSMQSVLQGSGSSRLILQKMPPTRRLA
jgi:hypothetical protein